MLLVDVTKADLIFREKVSTDFLGLNIDVEVVELKLTDFGRCEIEDLRDDFKEGGEIADEYEREELA